MKHPADILDLAGAFGRHFRVVPAFNSALQDICYRIRHSVYCEEFGFEPMREDGRETDAADAHSLHCLLQNVATGQYVGCVRLVIPPTHAPSTLLPFERVCKDSIDRSIVDPRHLPRDSIGEISRLAVIPEFRRRGPETSPTVPRNEHEVVARSAELVPYIQAGLYLGVFAMAHLHGIERVFMLLEPRLARQMGLLVGVRPEIIGSAVEHRGARVPGMLWVQQVLDNPRFFMRPLFDSIWTDLVDAVGHAAEPLPERVPAAVINKERLERRRMALEGRSAEVGKYN